MKKPKKPKKPTFTPWAGTLTKPPPQYYDPTLDAQERASGRGLSDLIQDALRNQQRGGNDYRLARGNLIRTGMERYLDLRTQRQQAAQDYGSRIAGLGREYANRAQTQTQSAQAAGVTGGALQQAIGKRIGNYQQERAPIDTNFRRYEQQTAQQQARLGQAGARGLGELALNWARNREDRRTDVTRAQRENTFFKTDIARSRFYSAKQAGWAGPGKEPKGEHTRHGITYRVDAKHKGTVLLPDGRRISRRKLRGLFGKAKAYNAAQANLLTPLGI